MLHGPFEIETIQQACDYIKNHHPDGRWFYGDTGYPHLMEEAEVISNTQEITDKVIINHAKANDGWTGKHNYEGYKIYLYDLDDADSEASFNDQDNCVC